MLIKKCVSGLVTKVLDKKINKIDNKVPDTSGLVNTVVLIQKSKKLITKYQTLVVQSK